MSHHTMEVNLKRKATQSLLFLREEDVGPPSDDFLAWREASEHKLLD